MIHAFISSKIDYCNGLLIGLPKKTIRHLQLIQNSAARVLTEIKRMAHSSPVLKFPHWLPVSHRIAFKVLLLIYNSLYGTGPRYILICNIILRDLLDGWGVDACGAQA
ncbi:hypothetical protein LDENG_00245490 [Lucifuga dentata]|nr:hypothetical protein LDENG_00245490 [Lucifuga dentata]